jgi:hypothetical protein
MRGDESHPFPLSVLDVIRLNNILFLKKFFEKSIDKLGFI